jgi:hypothetical protein
MSTLSNSGTFTIASGTSLTTSATEEVIASVAYPIGKGRIVHPVLGVFDYEYAPDEWTNLDGDAIYFPTWAATKSLAGASSSLWAGNIRDVTVEERWTALGGLGMPIGQLRTLIACMMNPVDPSVGYMQLYPNYTTDIGYNVLLLDVITGSAGSAGMPSLSGFKNQGMVFNVITQGTGTDGNGWVDRAVSVFWKLVSRVS